MTTVHDILDYMWLLAPEEGKESWDNVGLLVGHREAQVTKVLVALDITMPVIQEAAELGAELIVSHHPVIWDTHKHVNDTVFQQSKVLALAENHLAAICMHTNLDEAADGVDDTLTQALGLMPQGYLAEGKIGHISCLDRPVSLLEFLPVVKNKLKANGLRYCDAGKPVYRIATGCGSCGEYLENAVRQGCDTFITGDVKYNVWIDALGQRINLIDAGHFPTENPIVEKIAEKLKLQFPDLQVHIAESIAQPDQFFVE